MSAGKGMAPRKGYNWAKYAENYDAIFRPNQRKEPMKTPEQEQPDPQPILPWHREAAKEIFPYGRTSYLGNDKAAYDAHREREWQHCAAIIARHDPHAAQHATTLRLLRAAAKYVPYNALLGDWENKPINEVRLANQIDAHLAAQGGAK